MTRTSMDAHCTCWDHRDLANPCRLNRTLKVANPARSLFGRPYASLRIWLLYGVHCVDKARHKASAQVKGHTAADDVFFNWDDRNRLRQAAANDGCRELVNAERPKRDDELDEPVTFYYMHK